MQIHCCTPYRVDKDLGKAYNEAFAIIPDGDWICILDYDVLILHPNTIKRFYEYINYRPDAGAFVCYTNRSHPTNMQLYKGIVNDNPDITYHMKIAAELDKQPLSVTEVTANLSGFLMLIPKTTWQQIKFVEGGKCLGVDTLYSMALRSAGLPVYRMNTIYVWHTYRLLTGIKNKNHLF